jgi:hypothetical protein
MCPDGFLCTAAAVVANNEYEDSAMNSLSVSEAARRLGARPKDISDLFYRRALRDDLCPIVAGRRLIPDDHLDTIRLALKHAGRPVDGGTGGGA